MSYPNTELSSWGNGDLNTGDKYPQKILPCNRLYVRSDTALTENLSFVFHGFPSEFFLCLAFIEVFLAYFAEGLIIPNRMCQTMDGKTGDNKTGVTEKQKEIFNRGQEINLSHTSRACDTELKIRHRCLVHVADGLSSFLQKTDLPPVIKEIIFHLLAQLLRVSMVSETQIEATSRHPAPSKTFSLILKRLSPLCTELPKVLEKEISFTTTTALNFVLNCNFEKDKFTSYLQALFELVLAIAEVSHCSSLPRIRQVEHEKNDQESRETDGDDAQVSSTDIFFFLSLLKLIANSA